MLLTYGRAGGAVCMADVQCHAPMLQTLYGKPEAVSNVTAETLYVNCS